MVIKSVVHYTHFQYSKCTYIFLKRTPAIEHSTDVLFFWQLDLQLQDEGGGDISSFVTNGEWELIGNNATLPCFVIG